MKNRIKEIRKEKGLSAEDLGRMLGTTQATVSRLERGKQKLDLEWIAKLALGVSKAELIEDDEQNVPHTPTRIKEFRQRLDISASELAEAVGMTQPNLTKIENGQISVSLDIIYRIAAALHCDPLDLIRTDGEIEVTANPGAIKVTGTLRTVQDAEWLIARINDLKPTLQPHLVIDGKVVPLFRKS